MLIPIKYIVFLIYIVLFLSLFVPNVIRSMPVFMFLVTLAGVIFLTQFKYVIYKNPMLKFVLYFSLVGLVYLIASVIIQGWTDLYRFDSKHILRQSYFVLTYPLFVVVGISTYRLLSGKFEHFFSKIGLSCFVLILSIDMLTAFFIGDSNFRIENGYSYSLDKGLIWFFGSMPYFYCVAYNIHRNKMFLLLNVIFLSENIAGYGVMFNAMTGFILYVMMFLFYVISIFSFLKKFEFITYFSIVCLLMSFVLIAPVFSELFINDYNTYWRLNSWKDNLSAIYSNWGFGSGFGVAYFPSTPEALDAAYRSYLKDGSHYNMYDSLFVRGQHSSIINMFFRTGILGGSLLIYIILKILKQASYNMNNKDVRLFSAVFVCGILNISVHVGFESPPYLMTISIATGMLMGAISIHKKT